MRRLPVVNFTIFAVVSLAVGVTTHAEPILTSWFTANSSVYARVIQTTSASTGTHNTSPVTTWPTSGINNGNNGGLAQTLPAYADVQRIRYDAANVYINSSGLTSYTMGPWLTSGGGLFGFWPVSQNFTVKIPRTPATPVPSSKTRHQGGVIGLMVNGVGIYDLGDAFGFVQTGSAPVTGSDSMGSTDTAHPWWRDALAVEVVTFDPGFAHQPGLNGQYHYHAEPKALRYQLGDNMRATFDPTNNTYSYTEDTNTLHHSPILGWSFDGYPIYGPYGYSNPTNPASPVTRMRSSFVLRNAANQAAYGTANIVATGRTSLPKWAAIAEGFTYVANTNGDFDLAPALQGPATTYVNGPNTYSLGRYVGDYDYLGDRGQTQGPTGTFDLDQYNGRQCVTPEFPGPTGTYAYFVTLDTNGAPAFPYMLGKQYYGTKSGTAQAVTVPATGVTNYFSGGTNLQEVLKTPVVNNDSGTVTLTWSSVEGGTYILLTKTNLISANWITNATVSAATNNILTTFTDAGAVLTNGSRFYRTDRTAVAPFTQ
jgi:hypothetical protein